MAYPSSSYSRARAVAKSRRASSPPERGGGRKTRSTSHTDIPDSFHARLAWIGYKSMLGWTSVNETWKELWELQEELTPYLKGDKDGTARK